MGRLTFNHHVPAESGRQQIKTHDPSPEVYSSTGLKIQLGNILFAGDNFPCSVLDDELDEDIAPQPLSLTDAEHSFAGWRLVLPHQPSRRFFFGRSSGTGDWGRGLIPEQNNHPRTSR